MSSDADKQTSSTLAHEAEDVRANLAHTLEQLRENLKPEHVIEEVVSNARAGANTVADGLYTMARENPLPALLLGAGCALILGLGSKATAKKSSVLDLELATPDPGSVKRQVDRIADMPRLRLSAKKASRTSLADASPDSQEGSAGLWSPYRRLDTGSSIPDVQSPPTAGRDTMERATGAFRPAAGKAGTTLSGIFHEQPLIIAALGVAVGAAIGAALPATKVEDAWMGGTSASLKHAAQDVARAEIDELKAAASRTAETFKHSMTDHG